MHNPSCQGTTPFPGCGVALLQRHVGPASGKAFPARWRPMCYNIFQSVGDPLSPAVPHDSLALGRQLRLYTCHTLPHPHGKKACQSSLALSIFNPHLRAPQHSEFRSTLKCCQCTSTAHARALLSLKYQHGYCGLVVSHRMGGWIQVLGVHVRVVPVTHQVSGPAGAWLRFHFF